MKTSKFFLLGLVINFLFAATYGFISPAGYPSHVPDNLQDFIKYLLSLWFILVIWIMGLQYLLAYFWDNCLWAIEIAKRENDFFALLNYPPIFISILMLFGLLLIGYWVWNGKWRTLKKRTKFMHILFISLCFNSMFLDTFAILMGV